MPPMIMTKVMPTAITISVGISLASVPSVPSVTSTKDSQVSIPDADAPDVKDSMGY